MARVNIPVQHAKEPNVFAEAAAFANILTALDTTDGGEIVWDMRDEKMLLVIENVNSASKKVTINAGNGIQGVNPISVDLAQNQYTIVCIESGRFKNVSGADKGKVIITSDGGADIKVGAFQLL